MNRNVFRISNIIFSVSLSLAVFLSYKMPTEFKTISWNEQMEIGLLLFHNMNAAIATFSIVQMLMLDGILTYTVWWMMRHGVPRILLGLTVAYYALNPLICRYSFTMWKDILFSGTILLLVLFLYDLVTDESRSLKNNDTLMKFVTLSVLVSFLRNRIVYAVLFVFLLLVIVTRGCRRKLALVFGITGAFILV